MPKSMLNKNPKEKKMNKINKNVGIDMNILK